MKDTETIASPPEATTRPARDWMTTLAKYREPIYARSLFEIAVTVIPFIGFCVAAWWALSISYVLTLLITIPAGFFLVRLFLIQHDCGHGAFFASRAANDWLGRILGVFTLTPYLVWKRAHAIHHSASGNLDKRGHGDLYILTVTEFSELSGKDKFLYRLYRHPLVLFVLGPAYQFLLQHRVPFGFMREGWRYWMSAMGTNLGILALAFGLIQLIGVGPFLMLYLPISLIAAAIGVWLFYIQHQFEHTYWDEDTNWELHEAALYGSSHYDLPQPLRWLTANIGIHHVHHLYARIPFYRLSHVLRDFPELADIHRMTLKDSLACIKLQLWDENRRRLVSYAEMKRNMSASPA